MNNSNISPDAFQQNALLRQAYLNMTNPVMNPIIGPNSILPANQLSAIFRPRPNGLLTGFLVSITASLRNGSAAVANLANFGISNLIRQIRFRDLSNNDRILLSGRDLHALNTFRQEWLFGAAYNTNVNTGFGVNKPIFMGATTVAAGADTIVTFQVYVPIAYGGNDLTGAVLLDVADQTVELEIALNPKPFGGPFADGNAQFVDNVYTTTTQAGANLSGYTPNVPVQISCLTYYRDGAPESKNYIPPIDLSTSYEIKTTSFQSPIAGNDFPLNFTSLRSTLSSYVVFDNGGALGNGSEINYFTLTQANTYNRFRLSAAEIALRTRQIAMADSPNGSYYFSYRDEPIDILANGSVQLLMNANLVNPAARVFHTTESFVTNGVGYGAFIDTRIPSLDAR